MPNIFVFDRIQFFSILFSLFIFFFIFSLVKNRRVKEEYSILWFAMSLFLLYLSLDRFAIDRLGQLFGIAYPPSVLTLMTTGFTFLLLIHLTVVVTRLSEQNKEMIQELGLNRLSFQPKEADLLVIVPAYNEAKAIGQVIEDLRSINLPLDILVVNDGSVDATSAQARASGVARVIDLPKNLGIGGAVQTGFKYAATHGYSLAIQFDGDGQHLASEIPGLLKALTAEEAQMVIGSRFLKQQAGYRSTFARRMGIRLFQVVNSLLIGQRVTDNTSGFRVYGRKAIEFLARHYPVDYPEPEAVILLGRNGFRIAEAVTLMRERQGGGSSIAGITGVYYMIKVLLAILMTALRKPLKSPEEA
ncbi:DUF2304 family protein [Desulfuromonas sp. KJ2020]|uniref:DUF2304 family protein n=1 Tax=Desulfuromonas sp. KJ2020 TaxID=2919173 RepID=UPI000326A0A5|nr:DUF2304 family protein [Desulfuromonas sp. KJ2020]MCP3175628.1 DUF2304 family protein [Desulfuromonas sp. KJ2020]